MAKSAKFDFRISKFRSYVDVIIPYHKNYHLVRKLLDSLFKLTSQPVYRIVLVDDGSPNESFVEIWDDYGRENPIIDRMGRRYPKVTGVRLDEQRGFGAALKAGYEASIFPYVCFLNSDCLIKNPIWLQEMGVTLMNLQEHKVGLVSARSNNAVSDIPELQGIPGDLEGDFIVDEFLPLYCSLCERKLFDKIGGFVKEYPYGMYEDEELFNRMKRYGYSQAISARSWVYHEGEATLKQFFDDTEIASIILDDNYQRLQEDLDVLG